MEYIHQLDTENTNKNNESGLSVETENSPKSIHLKPY